MCWERLGHTALSPRPVIQDTSPWKTSHLAVVLGRDTGHTHTHTHTHTVFHTHACAHTPTHTQTHASECKPRRNATLSVSKQITSITCIIHHSVCVCLCVCVCVFVSICLANTGSFICVFSPSLY